MTFLLKENQEISNNIMKEGQPIGTINKLARIGVIAGSLFVAERLAVEVASAQNVTPTATLLTPLVDDIARIRVLSEATAIAYEKSELAKVIPTALVNGEYARVATIVASPRYNKLMATPEPQKAAILEEVEAETKERRIRELIDQVKGFAGVFGAYFLTTFFLERYFGRFLKGLE